MKLQKAEEMLREVWRSTDEGEEHVQIEIREKKKLAERHCVHSHSICHVVLFFPITCLQPSVW